MKFIIGCSMQIPISNGCHSTLLTISTHNNTSPCFPNFTTANQGSLLCGRRFCKTKCKITSASASSIANTFGVSLAAKNSQGGFTAIRFSRIRRHPWYSRIILNQQMAPKPKSTTPTLPPPHPAAASPLQVPQALWGPPPSLRLTVRPRKRGGF